MQGRSGRMLAVASVALLALPMFVQGATGASNPPSGSLEQKVRHELLMLPYYSLFDTLSFDVNGSQVTLRGQVIRPTLASDAANVVKRIPGVTGVTNQIEVLPLSPYDNRLRWAVARAVFSTPSLQRYALGARPAIHIIVKNGDVRLEGLVGSEMDKTLAGMRASGVFGAFSVTNDLRIG